MKLRGFNYPLQAFWLVIALTACAPIINKEGPLESLSDARVPELLPWQALLKVDAHNPDALFQMADYYAKRYIAAGNLQDKHKALHYSAKVFLVKPNDFATQTLVYGVYYQSVRKGQLTDFTALKSTYAQISSPFRPAFFPPSLALYLHAQEAPQAAKPAGDNKNLLLQAISEQPKNALLHVQYARLLLNDEHTEAALAVLQQALHLEPENAEVLLALGNVYRIKAQGLECVYEHLDDINKSTHYLKKAWAQQPKGADAHYGLMLNYAHLGLHPLSLREGDLWLKNQTTEGAANPAAVNQSRVIVAVLNAYQGDFAKASALFAQVPQVERQRGYLEALVLQAKWQQAAQVFPEYIQWQPQPSLQDLMLASMIVFEVNSPAVTLASLWKTEKKARFYSPWEEALAQFWRKDISLQALQTKAISPCQQADYEFYAGYFNWVSAQLKPAKAHFEKAKQMNQPLNFEAKMAEVFLRQL